MSNPIIRARLKALNFHLPAVKQEFEKRIDGEPYNPALYCWRCRSQVLHILNGEDLNRHPIYQCSVCGDKRTWGINPPERERTVVNL